MLNTKSHFTVRNSVVLGAAIAIPMIVALGGAFLLASQAFNAHENQIEQVKLDGVRAQSKLLAESVWDQIDSVKIRAGAFWKAHTAAAKLDPASANELDPMIQTFSEIRLNADGSPAGIRGFAQNSRTSTLPDNQPERVEKAALQISVSQARDAGVSLVRVGNELGVAFFAGNSGGPLLFVTTDPMDVFSSFSRWASRREAGNLRGYLIDSKGRVLVHSERAYSGADFSGTDVFRNALHFLFLGERISGTATFHGVDLRSVLTSYARLGSLPYAIVVERVVQPAAVAGETLLQEIMMPGILLLMTCLFLGLFGMVAAQKLIEQPVRHPDGAIVRVGAEFEAALSQISESHGLREAKELSSAVLERSKAEIPQSQTPQMPQAEEPPRTAENKPDAEI